MSLAAFQSALARLLTEPALRDEVRRQREPQPVDDLSPRERRRLRQAASDPGLAVTATLVASGRLEKLLELLPLTRALLGETRLMQEARAFWRACPPRACYAPEEALLFCDHLLGRAGRGPYVKEVVSYERAILELRRVRPAGETVPPQDLWFRHDPRDVLGPLLEGRSPRQARRWIGRVRASLAPDGSVEWAQTPVPGAAPAV